jgi:DNA-binding HxlR family transcriptional regulator
MELEKITKLDEPTKGRRFEDACGMAHGLELVGERWALFVVRELMFGPRRFGDLRADLPGISANVLSQRLTELEARGIVERVMLPPPAKVQVYGLTEWGHRAETMILEMSKWAMCSPTHDRTLPVNRVSMLLSMKTTIDMSKVGDLALTIGFLFDDAPYRARLDSAGLQIESGEAVAPDIRYIGRPRGLAERLYGKRPPAMLAEAGSLTIVGDPALEDRFAHLFSLPTRVAPPQLAQPGQD